MTERSPILILIHGLGATPGVWTGAVEAIGWKGDVRAPSLPGHGSAEWTGDYTLGALATAVAQSCADGERCIIVGHSLGGAVGIELASNRYRPDVTAVIGLGIKTTWTDEDVAGMAKVAGRGVRWFADRAGAVDRFLRQAGLDGIVDRDHASVDDAVVHGVDSEGVEGWRVAQDPTTFAQEPLAMAEIMADAHCPVVLGAGEHDAMATKAELARFVDEPTIAAGRGHNVHVEAPEWVAAILAETIGGGR